MPAFMDAVEVNARRLVFRVDEQLERRKCFLRISEPLDVNLADVCLPGSLARQV